jgi:hypothetical protein
MQKVNSRTNNRIVLASNFLASILLACNLAHAAIPEFSVSILDNPANTVGQYSAVAVRNNQPAISYYDATARDLRILRCTDAACNNSVISQLDTGPSFVGEYTSIAIPADNFPVVSYFDNTNKSLKVLKCNDADCLGANESIVTVDDPVNQVGFDSAIVIGADGLPLISYADLTAGTLKVAKCGNASCSAGNVISTLAGSTADRVGEFSAIAIGNDGLPIISFYATTATALRIIKCNDAACTGGDESMLTLDDDAAVGRDSAIAVPADGIPVLSYYDQTRRVLRVGKCTSSACTAISVQAVDSVIGNDRGQYTSIGIFPATGFPVISHYDATSGSLRTAFCGSADCSGALQGVAEDDQVNTVGFQASLAIGSNGMPIVSYHDATDGSLKVMTFKLNLFADGFE